MPSWLDRATAWVRALGGQGQDATPYPGTAATMPTSAALLLVETRMAEAICHGGGSHPGRRPRDAGSDLHEPVDPLRTLLGRPVQEHTADHDGGVVAMAAGYAAAGVRACAFVGLGGLDAARQALATAARNRTALVVHAAAEPGGGLDHRAWHAAADTGVAAAMATDPQHAVDLSVVARRYAEEAMLPVLVARDGGDADAGLRLPEPGLLLEVVGRPGDRVEAPTPAQAEVFAGSRTRLVGLFDPRRPVAIGMTPPGASADAVAASRTVFFDEPARARLQACIDAWAASTGRPAGGLRTHRCEDARQVLIVQGAVWERSCEAVDRAREAGIAAGAVAVVWLRPFPGEDLRRAMRSAEGVAVLERTTAGAGGPGPLTREVASLVTGVAPVSVRYGQSATLPDPGELLTVLERLRDGRAGALLGPGLRPPSGEEPSPRRRVLLDAATRLAPDLEERLIPPSRSGEAASDPAVRAEFLPMAVRRLGHASRDYASVSRFWGESYLPLGGGVGLTPEPYLGLPLLPAATSTFRDRAATRDHVPEIDPAACTGCGACWSACPEAAIAPVAAPTRTVLEAAFDRALGAEGREVAAGKLRRAFKQLAARLDRALARAAGEGSAVLGAETVTEAYGWLVEKMGVSAEERPAMDTAMQATMRALAELPPLACAPLFGRPRAANKDDGALLMLALDAHACQGCGLCHVVCEQGAVARVEATPERTAGMRAGWRAWEAHPDTPGTLMARARDDAGVCALGALLLSRHALLTLPGGDDSEPGSGARLAIRLGSAVAEAFCQQRVGRHLNELDRLAEGLRGAIRERLAAVADQAGADRIHEALADANSRATVAADLLRRLEASGDGARIDGPAVRRLAGAERSVEVLAADLRGGEAGVGASRYAVLVAGAGTASWLGRHPHNPFPVPAVIDPTEDALDHALGLARGLAARHTATARELALAELALAAPADLPERERRIGSWRWTDLEADARALCPPLLVIGDRHAICEAGASGLYRILASGLPIKVLLLDDRELAGDGPDPVLLALAHRRAPVASVSIAYPDHLLAAWTDALATAGPALLHCHAPRPAVHGYPKDRTLERARLAVACRVHPLLRYRPEADGVFGRRIDLSGNPDLERPLAAGADGTPVTVASWLAGEARFEGTDAEVIAAERAEHWQVLLELAGVQTPFAEGIRATVRAELQAEHAAALAALQAEHEAKLAASRAEAEQRTAARLQARLLQLVAAAPAAGPGPGVAGEPR